MKVKAKRFIGGGQTVAPRSPSRSRKRAYKTRLRKAKVQRGQALVLALCFIVLCTVLVVAFLTNVTTAKIGEKAVASENSASQLALSAVQLMESTITYATESGTDTSIAWACQPGMIRTYGNGGGVASSAPLAYYKLYSSGTMILNSTTGFSFVGDAPGNWDAFPSLYTDMNAPITTEVANTTGSTVTIFPIVDPRAADLGVEGFSFSSGTMDGVTTSGTGLGLYTSDTTSRLAMPVQWIYVLRDGSMTVPPGGGANSATWSAAALPLPSGTNPIVGRIAFWTDDESAKLNINTASEGTYWDTPVSNCGSSGDVFANPQNTALGDYVFATIQPAQHEYQRYPGHPATTCLSTVFGYALSGTTRAGLVQAITAAVPRVSDVGPAGLSSMGGTALASGTLATDVDRLYANLDEFQFTPSRSVQALGNASIKQQDIQACRFFLTAHSKAPELNLFGLPRVAIWPIWDDAHANNRTAFDREILRCSTINIGGTNQNAHEMAFFRDTPMSSGSDWNIYQTVGLAAQQQRNQLVYGYLQSLMGTPVPGFGGNFVVKYGQMDVNQILMEIFDYIRSTNLADNSSGATPYTTGTVGFNNVCQTGQVVPTQTLTPLVTGTLVQGLGRLALISELAVALTKVDDRTNTSMVESGSNLVSTVNVTGGGTVTSFTPGGPSPQTCIEWALIPKLCSPMSGYVALANNFRIHFTNVSLVIGSNPATTGTVTDLYDSGRISCEQRDSVVGGLEGIETLIEAAYQGGFGSPTNSMYPTGLVVVSGSSGPIALSGTVTAQVFAPSAATTPLQTFNFVFPSMQVPIPGLYMSGSTSWGGTFRAASSMYTSSTTTATFAYPAAINKTSNRISGPQFSTYVGSQDTIRSLVPTGLLSSGTAPILGDLRLLALTGTIPSTTFQLCLTGSGVAPSPTTHSANCMRFGVIGGISGNAHGSLVSSIPSTSYGGNIAPEVPPQATGTTSVPFPGDWDNGIGLMQDGPWANKPDEGMTGSGAIVSGTTPYIGTYETLTQSAAAASTYFSPNRQISSAVMFGSLPAGIDHPWRTLLFRPANLLSSSNLHPGGIDPTIRDHLLLDLFWMPVVEPYGISEPFTTAGKINLNTQIAPFTYVTRTTGMRAVLKAVMLTALNPTSFVSSYKGPLTFQTNLNTSNPTITTRYAIDSNQTLLPVTTGTDSTSAFPEFSRSSHTAALPNFFVSASQVCDIPLVPLSAAGASIYTTAGTLSTFWPANLLTGDNSMERPYSLIYPRVTTKSNIFTVHVFAQSLKKIASDPNQNVWNEGVDQVTGEFRGAFTIEKYFDPNSDDITYFTSGTNTTYLPGANDQTIFTTAPTAGIRNTKWRVLEAKRFGQ